MINSNKPALPLSIYQGRSSLNNTIGDSLSTLDNIKVREQIRSAQKARLSGNSKAVSESVTKNRLAQQVGMSAIRPLIRQRTARDFSND